MKATLGFGLAAITLAAIAAAWFWALPPLFTPLFYLHPASWTDADIVRHLWRVRLIQPEWVSSPPQYDYLRWAQVETLARLDVVFLGWLGAAACAIWSTCGLAALQGWPHWTEVGTIDGTGNLTRGCKWLRVRSKAY